MKYLAEAVITHSRIKHYEFFENLNSCKDWAIKIIREHGPIDSLDVAYNKSKKTATFYTQYDKRWGNRLKNIGSWDLS